MLGKRGEPHHERHEAISEAGLRAELVRRPGEARSWHTHALRRGSATLRETSLLFVLLLLGPLASSENEIWLPGGDGLVAQVLDQTGESLGGGGGIDPEAAPRPTASAARTRFPVVVDGVLDESAWTEAEPITGFVQAMPDAGHPATEETVVRVLFDEEYIYIGALLLDSDPAAITAQFLNQDYETHDDDVFAVSLDTFLDRRNSFMFLINPHGAVKDGQTFDNSRTSNLAWEGVIEVETSIHEGGWTVELAIPFTTLRYDPRRKDQSWGMNFLRRLRRRNEDSYWAPLDRRSRIHTMALAGTLTGLQDLPRPRNLTVKPFVLADHAGGEVVAASTSGAGWDGGLDLKYGVTSRLTLDLTYRTDFSQVEVDQERVNLTRFSLFFPERRDFFVENAGIFSFGDVTERNYRMGASPRDFTLFHSRRIGLTDGRPVPIVGGGRLTGKVGSFDVGLLNMQTEATRDLPRELFSVARIRRTFGGVFQVGGLVASRDALGSGVSEYNRSYGVDANLRVRGKLLVHTYLAASDYPDRQGNNRAGRISAAFRDQLWDVSALYREVGDAFDPGMGFVSRRGIRHTYATFGAHPRPALPGVNEINPYLELDYITNLSSALETRTLTGGLGVVFLDGGSLTATAADRLEVIEEAFPVAGQGVVAEGRYGFREGSLGYRSNAARPLVGEVRISGGGFYDGTRRSVALGGSWRPNPHFALDLGVERNEIHLPEESFTADVVGARVDLAGSTRSFLSAFFQYNAASEDRVLNLRYNFIHSPLSDLFIVFSQRQNPDQGGVLERTVTLKATKLLSF